LLKKVRKRKMRISSIIYLVADARDKKKTRKEHR